MRTLVAGVSVVVLVGAGGCGGKKDKPKPDPAPVAPTTDVPTTVEPDPTKPEPVKPSAVARRATVDLTLTGAVNAKIAGVGGTCTCAIDKASIQVRSTDFKVEPPFELTVLVTSPEEWANPAIILNVKAPARGSFGRNLSRHRPEDKLGLTKDCSLLSLDDVVLKGIATKGDVAIKGTVTCAE